LVKKRVVFKDEWNRLLTEKFTPEDCRELGSLLFQALYEPFLPIPTLTRESKSFPTIFQNLIAQMMYPPPPMFSLPLGSLILENLFSSLDSLRAEITDHHSIQELIRLRWVLALHHSCKNFRGFEGLSKSLVLKLGWLIRRTVKIHCKATFIVLNSISENYSLLSEYCCRVIDK
jgi:hypothetical protein